MKVLLALVLLVAVGPAYASNPGGAPSPEMDLGLASLAMVAGAAYLAHRRRRG